MLAESRSSKALVTSFRLPYQRAHEYVMVTSYDVPKSSVFYLSSISHEAGILGVLLGYGGSSSRVA